VTETVETPRLSEDDIHTWYGVPSTALVDVTENGTLNATLPIEEYSSGKQ
jgi:hypothetical protein